MSTINLIAPTYGVCIVAASQQQRTATPKWLLFALIVAKNENNQQWQSQTHTPQFPSYHRIVDLPSIAAFLAVACPNPIVVLRINICRAAQNRHDGRHRGMVRANKHTLGA